MCTYSMIAQHYTEKWYPNQIPVLEAPLVWPPTITETGPTREEFDNLKKEVLDMKALLIKAKKYDKDNNQPDCETEEKIALIKQIAKLVGVDLQDAV